MCVLIHTAWTSVAVYLDRQCEGLEAWTAIEQVHAFLCAVYYILMKNDNNFRFEKIDN